MSSRPVHPPERFDPGCRRCPRLAAALDEIKATYPDYHAAPVAPFGPARPRLLVVGLAPGLHGANATGRPFTGDYAGILLFQTLYELGLANQPTGAHPGDGLRLYGCRITNAVKCLPPANKPNGDEINQCNSYLAHELRAIPKGAVVLALGKVAHDAVVKASGQRPAHHRFRHGAVHDLDTGRALVDSYHCSRYNTQTGRLTAGMFRDVVRKALSLAHGGAADGHRPGSV